MDAIQQISPNYQEVLQQWYQLIVQHTGFSVFLMIAASLVTLLLYGFRVALLKRTHKRTLKEIDQYILQLEEVNTQLENLQQQNAEASETIQTKEIEIEKVTETLQERNEWLVGQATRMVDAFQLSYDVPSVEGGQILSSFQEIVTEGINYIKAEQNVKADMQTSLGDLQTTLSAETAKLAEKETQIGSLQSQLDAKSQQLTTLEAAAEQKEEAFHQLEMEKKQLVLKAEQNTIDLETNIQNEALDHSAEQNLSDTESTLIEEEGFVSGENKTEQIIAEETELPSEVEKEQPETEQKDFFQNIIEKSSELAENQLNPVNEKMEKFKGFFGKALDTLSQLDEKLGSPTENATKVIDNQDKTQGEQDISNVSVDQFDSIESEGKGSQIDKVTSQLTGLFNKLTKK